MLTPQERYVKSFIQNSHNTAVPSQKSTRHFFFCNGEERIEYLQFCNTMVKLGSAYRCRGNPSTTHAIPSPDTTVGFSPSISVH